MPTKQIQRLVDFGLGRETARGTAEAAADFWVPKLISILSPEPI